MENKWIEKYHNVINSLKEQGRPTGVFSTLDIKKHYKNERVESCGWKFNRHHIEEISISGTRLKKLPQYETGEVIIVDLTEHLLLHYIIVMAGTTKPNTGMLMQLQYCEDPIGTWEEHGKNILK